MTDIADTIRRVRELDAAATKGPWKPSVGVYQDMDGDSEADDCFFGRGPVPFPHARALGEADAALIAEYRTAAPALAYECERLRACMAKAGLAAFMRDGDPEAVAEHLRSVIDSYEKPATECERLRERNAWLEPHVKMLARAADVERDEKLRLRERGRVLEGLLTRVVKYVTEDRDVAPGVGRLGRVVSEARAALAKGGE